MRVKVCGLTLLRDVRLAEAAGATWLGIVVEAPSPRAVGRERAALLARAARLPVVYVVVDMATEALASLAGRRSPAAVQLHGGETPEAVAAARAALPPEVEVWRALPLAEGATSEAMVTRARKLADAGAGRLVLDSRVGPRGGEEGPRVDLGLAREVISASPVPCLVAGGLRPEDLAGLWEALAPDGLDLSSGLEEAPGVKDAFRMRALAAAIAAGG